MATGANTLWVEKYRPKALNDFVLNDDFRKKVQSWIDQKDIPHLLLCGSAGTGKTSLALFLRDQVAGDNHTMVINASDENNVETIRTKIQNFAMGVSFGGGLKVCVFDEVDGLTPQAQRAFRNIMETYSANTRFILTCNYPDRLIDPLKSRCQTYNFTEFKRSHIMRCLATVMVKEGVKGTPEQLELIADSCGTDLRRAIGLLQFSTNDGRLMIDKKSLITNDYKYKVVELLNSKNLSEIREIIATNMVKDFTDIYKFLFDRADDIAVKDSDDARLIIAEYMYRDSMVGDKEVNFAACILQLMKQ